MGPPHRKVRIPIRQRAEARHRKKRLGLKSTLFDIQLSSDMVYCVPWKLWDHLTGKLGFQFARELKPTTNDKAGGWSPHSVRLVDQPEDTFPPNRWVRLVNPPEYTVPPSRWIRLDWLIHLNTPFLQVDGLDWLIHRQTLFLDVHGLDWLIARLCSSK